VAVWAVAFATRIALVVIAGGTGAVMENDDGVYLGAAIRATGGDLPYHDFLFVHPPGIVYLLSPFGLLAHVTSDPWAMLAARVAVAALGASTAVLIYLVVAQADRRAALFAGVFYAVSSAALAGERTVMLEAVLNFCLVGSLWWLGPTRRRQVLSGALVGLGAATKLFLLPVAPVLLWAVWRRHGTRAAMTWTAAASLVVVVLVLPALLVAPSGFVDQVFGYQLGRARVWTGWASRVQYLDWMGGPPPIGRVLGTGGMAALGLALLLFAMLALRSERGRVWAVLTLVTTAVVMAGPLFFDHYAAFVAAPEAVAIGFALAETRLLARHLRVLVPVGLAAAALVLAAGLRQATTVPDFPADGVTAALGDEQCVWTRTASTAIAVDREQSPCAGSLDDYATVLASGGGTGTIEEYRLSAAYQRQTLADLDRADAAVLLPGDRERWTDATASAFDERFPSVELVGQVLVCRRP
jgi:4-amino-4-deoxy-L-arabinose transferase-like glycosyltransferase